MQIQYSRVRRIDRVQGSAASQSRKNQRTLSNDVDKRALQTTPFTQLYVPKSTRVQSTIPRSSRHGPPTIPPTNQLHHQRRKKRRIEIALSRSSCTFITSVRHLDRHNVTVQSRCKIGQSIRVRKNCKSDLSNRGRREQWCHDWEE